MRKTLLCLASVVLAVPAAAHALMLQPLPGNFSVYYSYAYQKVDESTKTPSGSGVGISGELGLPTNLFPLFPFTPFIDGMYQYNGEDHAEFASGSGSGSTVAGLGLADQARVGGGVQLALPTAPVLVYAKADYVHYRLESALFEDDFGGRFRVHDNDDGGGYFGGFRTRLPGFEFYAEGGYLDLSDGNGAEVTGGVAIPLGPIIPRHAFVQLFAEYQWTRLHERDTAFHDIYNDYRAGIRMPFY